MSAIAAMRARTDSLVTMCANERIMDGMTSRMIRR
jgi:hypothetical protein